jgi:hypothetical protein
MHMLIQRIDGKFLIDVLKSKIHVIILIPFMTTIIYIFSMLGISACPKSGQRNYVYNFRPFRYDSACGLQSLSCFVNRLSCQKMIDDHCQNPLSRNTNLDTYLQNLKYTREKHILALGGTEGPIHGFCAPYYPLRDIHSNKTEITATIKSIVFLIWSRLV